MKTWFRIILGSLFLLCLFSFMSLVEHRDATPSSVLDSLQRDRDKHINRVKEQIIGKENLPADSVFKDIRIFKGVPANRLLSIMNIGYSRSLGVSCRHCHDTNNWESDPKLKKQIAREMASMTVKINNELLNTISGLKNPTVNCTTCHRGNIKPAINMN